MKKIITNSIITISSFIFGIFLTSFVYATVWPNTPAGEFLRGGLINYLEQSLVNTGSTTDGVIKQAADTDGLGSGTISSLNGNIGIGNSNPSSKLDVNGNIKASNIQILSNANSGNILISDENGNGNWKTNNYRLKAQSLMINGGTYGHNCFVMEDTSIKCLGYNGNGNIGIGTNTNNYYYPQKIPLTGVKKIFSNNLNTYALMLNGDVYFIGGYNNYGEGGVGDNTNKYIPTKIVGLSNVTDIETSGAYYTDGTTGRWAAHACALISDGTVKCWGRNGTGQLGNGDTNNQNVPTQVYGISDAKKIVMTDGQLRGATCALLNSGGVKCWGRNGRGILGNGDNNNRLYATTVNISNVADIIMGGTNQSGAHTCALINDGTVKCWGYNRHGELGNGNTTDQWNPTNVVGLTNVRKIVIAGGSAYTTYAITNDNKVYSWGYNGNGELGVGDTSNRSTPTLINRLNNVSDIVSTGWNAVSTCALINDGSIQCWGYNGNGQLGVGDTSNRSSPSLALGITNAISIQIYTTYRSTRPFTCALLDTGDVKCWGYNGYGQLGQGNSIDYYIPTIVKNLTHD